MVRILGSTSSADALANIERPWLLVVDQGFEREYVDGQLRLQAYFQVKNFGKSPAWIVEMGGTFEPVSDLANLSPEPSYRHTATDENRTIVIVPISMDEKSQQTFRIPHSDPSADIQLNSTQRNVVCVYGFVKYKDIFARTLETRFCCKVDQGNFRRVDVGPNYNRHS